MMSFSIDRLNILFLGIAFGPHHDISMEGAVLMEKPAVSAVFIRNAADGLDADSLAFAFGGDVYKRQVIFEKREHTVNRRSFAGAVWTEQTEDFPLMNGQIQMVQGNDISITLYHIIYFNHNQIPPL